jgi:hypothetical protein
MESRTDAAFFQDEILSLFDAHNVDFSCSVPFSRFSELKQFVEGRERWIRIDDTWSYFEIEWCPQSWPEKKRFIFFRQSVKSPIKGPLQLDFFEPRSNEYTYTTVVTNKRVSARHILEYHHGRGTQEKILGEAKQHAGLDIVAGKRLATNQVFTLSSMLAHNLSRELQMQLKPKDTRSRPKRPSLFSFSSLGTLRQNLIHRAGKLTRPCGPASAHRECKCEFRTGAFIVPCSPYLIETG